MIILGIESTCDETAAALVEDGRHLLSNVISTSVKEQALYGGVVPEIASRRHCEFIRKVKRNVPAEYVWLFYVGFLQFRRIISDQQRFFQKYLPIRYVERYSCTVQVVLPVIV